MLAHFPGKSILGDLGLARGPHNAELVVVDTGHCDMLLLNIHAARPPSFEDYHVVTSITRQAAAAMLGMPCLCTDQHDTSPMPIRRHLSALLDA